MLLWHPCCSALPQFDKTYGQRRDNSNRVYLRRHYRSICIHPWIPHWTSTFWLATTRQTDSLLESSPLSAVFLIFSIVAFITGYANRSRLPDFCDPYLHVSHLLEIDRSTLNADYIHRVSDFHQTYHSHRRWKCLSTASQRAISYVQLLRLDISKVVFFGRYSNFR